MRVYWPKQENMRLTQTVVLRLIGVFCLWFTFESLNIDHV